MLPPPKPLPKEFHVGTWRPSLYHYGQKRANDTPVGDKKDPHPPTDPQSSISLSDAKITDKTDADAFDDGQSDSDSDEEIPSAQGGP